MESKTQKIQIVDQDGTFILPNTFFQGEVKSNSQLNKEYTLISILGSQSSGKSTLLNSIFETNFEVLNSQDEGLRQTTKGIWCSVIQKQKTVVLDVEGVDSAERWDEGDDARRFSGSNLKLLQIIFEMNFRLFYDKEKPIEKKKLMIILRDFKANYNFKKITDAILGDFHKLWDEIVKPDEYNGTTLDIFFEICFESMPDYWHERDKFDEKASMLLLKFTEPGYKEYIFSGMKLTPTVPLDSLDLLMKSTWLKIKGSKEINLPSQRVLISEYKCSEVKNEIWTSDVKPALEKLTDNTKNIYANLAQDSEKIWKLSLITFESKTQFYNKESVEKNKNELTKAIIESLTKLLQRQINMINLYIDNQLKTHLENIQKETETNKSKFQSMLEASEKKILKEALVMLQNSEIKFLDFDITTLVEETQINIKAKFKEFRDDTLNKYKSTFFKKNMEKVIANKIEYIFKDIKNIFWEEFNKFFLPFWSQQAQDFQKNLMKGFELTKEETESLLKVLRSETEDFVVEKISQKKSLFHQYIKEIFDFHFKGDLGEERDWSKFDKAKIDNYYTIAIEFCYRVIDSFHSLEILEHKVQDSNTAMNTVVIENPNFKDLFTESDCQGYRQIIQTYSKGAYNVACIQSEKGSSLWKGLSKFL